MNRIRIDSGVYHCLSRTNGHLMLFERPDVKERLVSMLAKIAAFCSVDVLSFCVMGNHFHVLARETPVPPERFDDAELERRLLLLYENPKARVLFAEQQAFRQGGNDARADEILEEYRRMTGDVSWFMRLLKQRFSVWYNRTFGREGTLWSERFRSVAVEDSAEAVGAMAAYIDLNPVRADIVEDPRDFRWCTAGAAAAAGSEFARDAIRRVCALAKGVGVEKVTWKEADAWWRMRLEEVIAKAVEDGEIAGRVRQFARGAAIGSRAFVKGIVEGERGRKLPTGRKSEGARIPGKGQKGLYSLRKLSPERSPE